MVLSCSSAAWEAHAGPWVIVRIREVLLCREPVLVWNGPSGRSQEPMETILLHVEVDSQSRGNGTVDTRTPGSHRDPGIRRQVMLTREACPFKPGMQTGGHGLRITGLRSSHVLVVRTNFVRATAESQINCL